MFRLFPIKVTFMRTPLEAIEAESATVLARLNAMDVALIRLNNTAYQDIAKYVTAGSPLRLRWGQESRADDFVGYVHSFRPRAEGYERSTEILAISAAYPMFNESGVTYYNLGVHNVAQEIGDRYRFQVETDPHPYVHSQILQKSDSDWNLLVRLGEQWGYTLRVEGVTLIFRSLLEILAERYQMAQNERTYASVSTSRADILSFEPVYSASSAVPLTSVAFQGVDPVNLRAIEQQESSVETVFEEIDNRAVTSDLEGEQKSLGALAAKQFPYRAKAVIRAPFRRRPLDAYRITHDGVPMTWVALSIKHMVSGSDYQAEIEFGSDGVDHVGRTMDNSIDIALLLKRNQRARRPHPVIIDTRPYYVGAGANAVIEDQRWKARVMTVPVDDQPSELPFTPAEEGG